MEPTDKQIIIVAIFLIIMQIAILGPSADSDFIANWKFDENTGKTAFDSSANGNHGTVNGAIWAAGKLGTALSFDGVNDYVNTGNAGNAASLVISDAITVETWFKPTRIPQDFNQMLVIKGDTSMDQSYGIYLRGNDDKIYFYVRGGTYASFSMPANMLNNWYHIAGTYDGTQIKVYLNGVQSASTNYTGTIGTTTKDLNIGGMESNGLNFKGIIDEVHIYDRSLSASEILADFNACSSTTALTGVDPIGGGSGYSDIKSPASADYHIQNNASNRTYFLNALSSAKSGDIIFIDGDVKMDLTDYSNIAVPVSVTIASDRGNDGSLGALLYNNHLKEVEESFVLFSPSDGARFTGIRLRGPDYEIGNCEICRTVSIGMASFNNLEVDNSDISNWTMAIQVYDEYHNGFSQYIHHNYIHHNLRIGYGYGIAVRVGANPIIEANIFDWNSHSIAGQGTEQSGYVARNNIVLGNGTGRSFDMHGWTGGIAGNNITIHDNMFALINYDGVIYGAIGIRGTPQEGAYIYNNTFAYDSDWKDYNGNPPILQSHNDYKIDPMQKMYVNNNSYNGIIE